MSFSEQCLTESQTCLITGASSGIGAALARTFAARGYDLVLTARREDRLRAPATELSSRYEITVLVFPADLADPSAVRALLDEIRTAGRTIDVLVNNAGFGVNAEYHEIAWSDATMMMQLMVMTPATLTHSVLPHMRARKRGRILNVSSLAGLLPGLPNSTLYSACKAFVVRFSESLAAECADSDIRITVLCPGYVRTEFHQSMGIAEKIQKLPSMFWMDADEVAERGLRALERHQIVCIPGILNQSIAAIARFVPEGLAIQTMRLFSKRFQRSKAV